MVRFNIIYWVLYGFVLENSIVDDTLCVEEHFEFNLIKHFFQIMFSLSLWRSWVFNYVLLNSEVFLLSESDFVSLHRRGFFLQLIFISFICVII